MARFEDYRNTTDAGIDSEIQQSAEQSQARREIPDSVKSRFDGKSTEEILAEYAELERSKSRLGREVGDLRAQNTQLMSYASQATQPRQDTTESIPSLTIDDLYKDPNAAIASVVEAKTNARVKQLEDQLRAQDQQRAIDNLEASFPGWRDEVQSDSFRNWVADSSYRMRMAQDGDQGDLGAANDLLELWYERQKASRESRQEFERQQQLEAATSETSGPAMVQGAETFNRAELQDLRMRAAKGDHAASEWLKNNSNAINLAYAEGRVI